MRFIFPYFLNGYEILYLNNYVKLFSIYGAFLFTGNAIYIGDTALTISNILLPVLLLIFPFRLLIETKVNKLNWLLLFSLASLIVYNTLYFIINGNAVNELLYLVHVFFIFTNISLIKSKIYFDRIIVIGIYLSSCVVFLQSMYILDFLTSYNFMYVRSVRDGVYLITGGFGNPNNLAFMNLIAFVRLRMLNTENSQLAKILCIITIFITASRLCLILLLLYLLIDFIINAKRITISYGKLLFIPFALILIYKSSAYIEIESIGRVWNKIQNVLLMFSSDDSSSSDRLDAYIYILSNLNKNLIGYGSDNFYYFFHGYTNIANQDYLNHSPHSFIAELWLTYGLFSLFIIFSAFFYILRNYRLVKGMVFLILFVLASFSPSSILKMPCIGLMILSKSQRDENE
jgi:hypothetical protein